MRRSVVNRLGMKMSVSSHSLKGLSLGVLLLVGACGGGSKPPPGGPCLKNSDCTNPLSCSYGLCHVTCTEARDCPTGQDCIKAATGNVCQLPVEAKCEYLSQCMPPLVCALDRQCRSECLKDIDCPTPTQKCVLPDMVCAEPDEINPVTGLLKNSLGSPVPAVPPDAGAGDGASGDGGVNTVIGTAGGTVSGDGATVVVPAGALAQDQTVSIQVAPSGYPALPTGAVLLSSVLALEPHGQLFTKPVTVSIGFTARSQTTPELITASPGGSWAAVAGATVSGASMQATVAHFSFFAVVGLSVDGGAGGATGTGGMVDAAADSTGTGGSAGTPCPSPQTSFGLIGQGDSNPNFWSGVGALGPNVMYIFSGFVGPQGDAGAISLEVYVQAFDPKTGVSKGASKPLFSPPLTGYGGTFMASGQVNVFSAAISPTGDIALVYELLSGGHALYVAFLSPSTSNDGGVDGLQLQNVQLLATVYGGGSDQPRVIWSNASQTFIVNYVAPANHITVSKFAVGGQAAGGIVPVPMLNANQGTQRNGAVGESGSLLGVQYATDDGVGPAEGLTILDESENVVGTPIILASGSSIDTGLEVLSVAGTAQGFVSFYTTFNQNVFGELFVSTAPDAGTVGAPADGGVGAFPAFTINGKFLEACAISDDVGTGGKGGVGLALVVDSGAVSFAYVSADGVGHQGPFQVFARGAGQGSMWMTNFNGSFAISNYDSTAKSTQIVATGICP
jgi:hypothetical protein